MTTEPRFKVSITGSKCSAWTIRVQCIKASRRSLGDKRNQRFGWTGLSNCEQIDATKQSLLRAYREGCTVLAGRNPEWAYPCPLLLGLVGQTIQSVRSIYSGARRTETQSTNWDPTTAGGQPKRRLNSREMRSLLNSTPLTHVSSLETCQNSGFYAVHHKELKIVRCSSEPTKYYLTVQPSVDVRNVDYRLTKRVNVVEESREKSGSGQFQFKDS
ncbi:unnamed protein product [Parnassius apollo]|uniref:(apollo) hypothetical protein n=1 Tax=Parnassius apollo TaxID=110799 RepID=A0A8S3XKF0_PARAO|nr:unnamed protein product [Parnassius apollo]